MSENKDVKKTTTSNQTPSDRDEYVLRRGVIITDRNLFSIKKTNNENHTEKYTFGHNDIIIPVATLQAIREYIGNSKGKGMKKMIGERANEYLTSIEKYAFSPQGYPRGNGSYIKIVDCGGISKEIKKLHGLSDYDQRVLQVCKDRAEQKKRTGDEGKVILISSNISLRYQACKLANLLGLNLYAKPYEDDMYPEPSRQYTGMLEVTADYTVVETLLNGNDIKYEAIKDYDMYKWYSNMFITVKSVENSSVLAIYNHGHIYPISEQNLNMCKISPKNKEQKFFAYAFKKEPEECSLIIAKGAAGVGKTFFALAGALSKLNSKAVERMYNYNRETLNLDNPKDKKSTDHANKKQSNGGDTINNGSGNSSNNENAGIPRLKLGTPDGEFDKIILTTPMVTVSNEDLGALPGDKDAKTAPYFGGVMDNLEQIIGRLNPEFTPRQIENSIEKLFSAGIIEIAPIAFMRGRSFVRRCVILDEAQNVEPDDILDIVSRLGDGSRIVIIGDPQQVNKVGLNKKCNGIVYATEGLKEFNGCYVITFSDNKIQRSPLAKYAVLNLL